MTADADRTFLLQAIGLARAGSGAGLGGPFGAVVVKEGKVVAADHNRVLQTGDPTMHAEVAAIRRACGILGTHHLPGCTLYASTEPCPMCLGAVHWARLDRLVFASRHTLAAEYGFSDEAIYRELDRPLDRRTLPTVHLPQPEARAVFEQWRRRDGQLY